MSYIKNLLNEFHPEFPWVQESDIEALVSPSDWQEDDQGKTWVEAAFRNPGELRDHPHIVFCSRDNSPGAVTRRDYRPL